MANTNQLKYIVEPEIKRTFCGSYNSVLVSLSNKELQQIFNDMEPDLVAIDEHNGILHIGEITTSGFVGQKGRDFHIGAAKKIFEAFSKFNLIHMDKDGILQRLRKHYDVGKVNSIHCHFIVPEGARFIKALGYRAKLFDTGVMRLDKIKLSDETEQLMIQILMNSRQEMKWQEN